MSKQTKVKGGGRKIGRNRKPKDQAVSLYSKGKISFETYQKMKK